MDFTNGLPGIELPRQYADLLWVRICEQVLAQALADE